MEVREKKSTRLLEQDETFRPDASPEKLAKLAQRVGHKAPIALRLAARMIDAAEDGSLEEGLQMELDHLAEIFGTADAYEGLSSLGRKRPEFQDR